MIGPIKLFKIGVHKRLFQKEGYYFVEYYTIQHAQIAKQYFNRIVIDGHKMSVDFDIGY